MRSAAVAWALATALLGLNAASALELGDHSPVDAGAVGEAAEAVGEAVENTSRSVDQAVPEAAGDLPPANSGPQQTQREATQFGDPLILSADPTTLVGRQLVTSDAAVLGTVRGVQVGPEGKPQVLIVQVGEQEIRLPVELGILSDEGIQIEASAADARAFFELGPAPILTAEAAQAADALSAALLQPPTTTQQGSIADVPAFPANRVSPSEQDAHVQMPASTIPAEAANSDRGSFAASAPIHLALTPEADTEQASEPSQALDPEAPRQSRASLFVGLPLYGTILLVAVGGALLASKRRRELLRQSLAPYLRSGASWHRKTGAVSKRKRKSGTRKTSAAAVLTASPGYLSRAWRAVKS
jgi:hypothetical protein